MMDIEDSLNGLTKADYYRGQRQEYLETLIMDQRHRQDAIEDRLNRIEQSRNTVHPDEAATDLEQLRKEVAELQSAHNLMVANHKSGVKKRNLLTREVIKVRDMVNTLVTNNTVNYHADEGEEEEEEE